MLNEKEMVDDRPEEEGVESARNMADAANSNQSLEGYAAINNVEGEIAQRAYELFQERGAHPGEADGDWFRAEAEVQRNRDASDK